MSDCLYVLNSGVTEGVMSESLLSFRFNVGVVNVFVMYTVSSFRGCVEVEESESESISM